MSGKADYEERKQERIERLNAAAEKARRESNAAYLRSHDLVKNVPLGQPNISGRSALPNLRKKSIRLMEKAIELDDRASYYESRIMAAEENSAISSDDPDAIKKLQEKISELEAERERIKAYNKEARKKGTEPAPWYALPYLSKKIKAAKERIAKLERVDAMPAELISFDGGEIESDPITNRVIIRFYERQDDATIRNLKTSGFRWAPSIKAWQRMRTPAALRAACDLCLTSAKTAEEKGETR